MPEIAHASNTIHKIGYERMLEPPIEGPVEHLNRLGSDAVFLASLMSPTEVAEGLYAGFEGRWSSKEWRRLCAGIRRVFKAMREADMVPAVDEPREVAVGVHEQSDDEPSAAVELTADEILWTEESAEDVTVVSVMEIADQEVEPTYVDSMPSDSAPVQRRQRVRTVPQVRRVRRLPQISDLSELAGVMTEYAGEGDGGELDWQQRALCTQTDPEAFFPEKGGSTREAKRVCLGCAVRGECLDYAVKNEERFGIWGGLSERERRKLKKVQAQASCAPVLSEEMTV